MFRILVIAFLFGHGAIVAAQASGVPVSWLVHDRKLLGLVLTLAAGAAFVMAGAGLWLQAPWWRALAVSGAGLSLLFFAVFFQPTIVFGIALDVAVIVALVWFKWRAASILGA